MDIIEPVSLGDVAFTRPSPKWVNDRTGALVQVPAGSFAVTYDTRDLTRAPYALVEPAKVNAIFSPGPVTSGWGTNGGAFENSAYPDPVGTSRASRWIISPGTGKYIRVNGVSTSTDMVTGQTYTFSFFVKPVSGVGKLLLGLELPFRRAEFDIATMTVIGGSGYVAAAALPQAGGWYRLYVSFVGDASGNKTIIAYANSDIDMLVFGDQIEINGLTSYTEGTRGADAIASGAGLVYSNVPITEPSYNSATTYAKDAVVHDPATHNTYVSLIASNLGKALTDITAWAPNGVTNRWAMLDQYNNTQTTNAEEIILVLSPQAISQGFYVGNVDASEVRVSVVDVYKGLVYQETQSLRVSNSESSFFNWCFRRKRNRTWAVDLKLRPYANALVTIAIRKPGGTAKCGMCVVGPTMDLGRTLMTLGAEIKDFSDTSFNFDGTSKTTIRNWAKRISADVVVDASRVDDVYEFMASYRQRPLVWIGSPNYGLAIAYGRYSGIKPVVKGKNRWDMSIQIEGTV